MTEANKETSKMSETTMSETKATFSGAKRKMVQAVSEYNIMTGKGQSVGNALYALEQAAYRQIESYVCTPVGGATVLYDHLDRVWVAYQTFIEYEEVDAEE